jgi:nucleotide-binding universal stress UspA family protein
MEPIKKILVAIAFSKYSEEILAYAARIAGPLDAGLIITSIINIRDVQAVGSIAAMGYEVNGDHYVTEIEKERRKTLDRMLEKISFPTAKVRAIFKVGHPFEELLKIAVNENADLMVMGVKGRSDLEHILVGSVAEKIFRRSPVPILSYRPKEHSAKLKKKIDLS